MGEIRLFRDYDNHLSELQVTSFGEEKDLQKFFETNLYELTGIEFIKSEYKFKVWRGRRPDSLGLDEEGRLVVIEYKLEKDEGIIKQGLEYLYYLCHHEAEVLRHLQRIVGQNRRSDINVKDTWLLCVAKEFTHQDLVTAKFCKRRVELLQYQRFNDYFVVHYRPEILLPRQTRQTWLGTKETEPAQESLRQIRSSASPLPDLSKVSGWEQASPELQTLCEEVCESVLALGQDVQITILDEWIAFKGESEPRKNIAVVRLRPKLDLLFLNVAVDPASEKLQSGFTEFDKTFAKQSQYFCPLKIIIRNRENIEDAQYLIQKAYENHLRGDYPRVRFNPPTQDLSYKALPDRNTRTIIANEKFGRYKNWHKANEDLRQLFMAFHNYVVSLGEDVHAASVSEFIRFRWNIKQHTSSRRKNLIGVTLQPTLGDRRLFARVAYPEYLMDRLEFEEGFTCDLRGISRDTYGELGITINNLADLERAKPLLRNSYELF